MGGADLHLEKKRKVSVGICMQSRETQQKTASELGK